MIVVGLLIFFPLGLLMLFKPEIFWMLTEQWKSDDATEPSSLYLMSTRFGGVMLILVSTIGLILLLLNRVLCIRFFSLDKLDSAVFEEE